MENELREEELREVSGGSSDGEIIAARKLWERLNGETVQIIVGEAAGISVTSKEIAAAIEQQFGVAIDRRQIQAPEIRQPGTYDLRINLAAGVVANMTAVVV